MSTAQQLHDDATPKTTTLITPVTTAPMAKSNPEERDEKLTRNDGSHGEFHPEEEPERREAIIYEKNFKTKKTVTPIITPVTTAPTAKSNPEEREA
ncbi:7344_t:CDS:2, partial [Ambispora leptoticha]